VTLISVNTGKPRNVDNGGKAVRTSIWKTPREGRVAVRTLNVDGDEQSDLTVHGGTYKAVYCYPSEHYAYWRGELPDADLPWGAFGENLTLEGLLETEVCIGDRFRIGTAEFQVTQPRQPCFKLQIRHRRDDLIKRFVDASRPGFYVAVTQEGTIGKGDAVQYLEHASPGMSVREIFMLHYDDRGKHDDLRRAAALTALSPGWREHFQKRASSV